MTYVTPSLRRTLGLLMKFVTVRGYLWTPLPPECFTYSETA